MAYFGPPPEDAANWPFSRLLEFCLINGVGQDRELSSSSWTTKSFAHDAKDFSYRTVEAWMQAANLPSEELLDVIIKTICRNEPKKFKNAWKRDIALSYGATIAIEPGLRKQASKKFKARLMKQHNLGGTYRALLKAIGENRRSIADRHIKRLINRPGDKTNQEVSRIMREIQEAKKARERGELNEAQSIIVAAQDELTLLVEEAYAIINAFSVIKGEIGELNYEQNLFDESAENFFRALQYLPRESKEENRLSRRFWYATNKAIANTPSYAKAKKLYRRSQRLKLRPDPVALTALISKANTFEEARAHFDKLKNISSGVDAISYTSLIAKTGDPERISALVQDMKRRGIDPNITTFNTILSKCKSKKQRQVVLNQLRDDGLRPNIYTYGILVEKAPSYNEAKLLLDQMRSAGIEPNEFIAASLVKKVPIFDQAVYLLKGLVQEGTSINEPAIIELMKKTNSFEELVDCLNWHQGLSQKLSIKVFNKAMKNSNGAFKTQKISSLALEQGLELDDESFLILMQKSSTYEDCELILNEMTRKGVPPSKFTYNIMLNKTRHQKQVLEILGKMKDAHISPSTVTIGTLVNKTPSFINAVEILKNARNAGILINATILNTVLKKSLSYTQAVGFLDKFTKYGVTPDQYTVSEIVKRAGSFNAAKKTIVGFADKGVKPNAVIFRNLLKWVADYEQYIETRKLMKESGVPLSGDEDLKLLENMRDFPSAFAVLERLHHENTNLSHRGIEQVLSKSSTYDEAESIFTFMKNIGSKPSTKHYSLLIKRLPDFRSAYSFLLKLQEAKGNLAEQIYAVVASKATNLDDLITLINEMRDRKRPLTSITFYPGIARLHDPEDAVALLELVFGDSKINSGVLIPLISRTQDFSEASAMILKMSKEKHVYPKAATFAKLAAKAANFDEAYSVLARLKATHNKPTGEVYQNIIVKAEKISQAKLVMKEMESEGIRIGSDVVIALISISGDFKQGKEFFEFGILSGLSPNQIGFGALAKKTSTIDEFYLYRDLCGKHGQKIHDSIVSGLISSSDTLAIALEIVEELEFSGLEVTTGNFSNLSRKAASIEDIEKVVNLAGKNGLEKSPIILNAFVSKAQGFAECLDRFTMMSEMGFVANLSTIRSLCSRATIQQEGEVVKVLANSFDVELTADILQKLEALDTDV